MCVCVFVSPQAAAMKWATQFELMNLWQGQEVVRFFVFSFATDFSVPQSSSIRWFSTLSTTHTHAHFYSFAAILCSNVFFLRFYRWDSEDKRREEKDRWKHCSHPSHMLVSQIIIVECSTLINAIPCLDWWGLSMIQCIYSTDLDVTNTNTNFISDDLSWWLHVIFRHFTGSACKNILVETPN